MSWFYSKSSASLQAETIVWRDAAIAGGGTFESNSIAIADDLAVGLNTATYRAKIKIVWPLLGSNLDSMTVPLIDDLGVGEANRNGFASGDYSQATGLQCTSSVKYLALNFLMGQLNATDQRGGIGVWERNASRTGDGYVMGAEGATNADTFALQLHPSADVIYYGNNGSRFFVGSPAQIGGFHYAQRSATNVLRLFRNGTARGTYSSTYTPTSLSSRPVYLGAVNGAVSTLFAGNRQVGYAIATDGTLLDAEVADLYSIFQTRLITPTGR